MAKTPDILIVGAGIFGATAALELQKRGHQVTLLDPGPLPHPLAASTDISKVVRMEYGEDEQYMAMVEQSIVGFRRWNEELPEAYYHETGVTMFTMDEMAPGGFEYDSYHMLLRRGHSPERLDANHICERFPAWKKGTFVDGFFHGTGGYVESGNMVSSLVRKAEKLGTKLIEAEVRSIVFEAGIATGVVDRTGKSHAAGHVIVAAGAWTPLLVPALSSVMKSTGHPVFHLKPDSPDLFSPPQFGTFTADVARTGWYGFPYNPREGVVKIANHGVGEPVHPRDGERIVRQQDEQNLRQFLSSTFPSLQDAPIVFTRRCLYADTRDEHFWIDHHPESRNLTIASGGSGHGFKVAPVLGPLIADRVENKPNMWLPKFAWRDLSGNVSGEEAARYHG